MKCCVSFQGFQCSDAFEFLLMSERFRMILDPAQSHLIRIYAISICILNTTAATSNSEG